MQVSETIAAISTPVGEGAVGVLRLSGRESRGILERIFRARTPVAQWVGRKVYFGRIQDGEEIVDEVLAVFYPGPGSYTGEDVVEIFCHGGILVTAQILQLLLARGARAAGPGEFTQRAFLNGKMDLTQAEAVMDLIRAQTPLARRAATAQLSGRIGSETEGIREELLACVAHLEAYIDFPEEGIDPDTGKALDARMGGAEERIQRLLATAEEGRILREGVKLAICGKPNAGKSSLLNCLIGYERAIVSDVPGTTRDTIEEVVSLMGIPFRIIDTAGIRESADHIEREGILRARRAAEQADLVLLVEDAMEAWDDALLTHPEKTLRVLNKVDLIETPSASVAEFSISCKTGQGIPELVAALARKAGHQALALRDSAAAINARHQGCLLRSLENLRSARRLLQAGSEPELVAIELRAAMDAVGEVAGRLDAEDILGKIFSSFCIGK